jgi:hypothetical protein
LTPEAEISSRNPSLKGLTCSPNWPPGDSRLFPSFRGSPRRPLGGSRKPTSKVVSSRQGGIFETAPVDIGRKLAEKSRTLSRDFSKAEAPSFRLENSDFGELRFRASVPSASTAAGQPGQKSLGMMNAVSRRPHSKRSSRFTSRNPDSFGISHLAESTDF